MPTVRTIDGILARLTRHYPAAVFHGGRNDSGYWVAGADKGERWAWQRNCMVSVEAAYVFARVMMEEFNGA